MSITEVKASYPYTITYLPKKDYDLGISRPKDRKDEYENIFIASNKRKYWILYADTGDMTGSFKSKREAVAWFRGGGR